MKHSSVKQLLLAACLISPIVSTNSSIFANEKNEAAERASKIQSLNDLFSRQWVATTPQGDIHGSVVGLVPGDKVSVGELPVFLVNNNSVVHKVKTNSEGSFTLTGVSPGTYSLIVRTSDAIGAFALHVLDSKGGKHLGSDIEVRLVKPAELATNILREQTLPGYAMNVAQSEGVTIDPLGTARKFAQSQAVRSEAGKLVGQLSAVDNKSDLSDMMVYILKEGRQIAKAPVSENGEYSVEGLKPGVYGLIAAGESGFAATSFEFIDQDSSADATTSASGEKFVGLFKHACRRLNVECVPTCEVNVCQVETVAPETIVAAPAPMEVGCGCGEVCAEAAPIGPACGCGCGFGYSGGFGGGFGGGGGFAPGNWAGLAGIAGLATVAGIIAADDDDAPITSPVGP